VNLDLRFLSPRSVCALCGRLADPEGALVLERTGEAEVDVSAYATRLKVDIQPGERLVICAACRGEEPTAS
jgi:hypothetical protein